MVVLPCQGCILTFQDLRHQHPTRGQSAYFAVSLISTAKIWSWHEEFTFEVRRRMSQGLTQSPILQLSLFCRHSPDRQQCSWCSRRLKRGMLAAISETASAPPVGPCLSPLLPLDPPHQVPWLHRPAAGKQPEARAQQGNQPQPPWLGRHVVVRCLGLGRGHAQGHQHGVSHPLVPASAFIQARRWGEAAASLAWPG